MKLKRREFVQAGGALAATILGACSGRIGTGPDDVGAPDGGGRLDGATPDSGGRLDGATPDVRIGPDATAADGGAVSTGRHAYFDRLAALPSSQHAYALRTNDEINRYRHPGEVDVAYDPAMDAANWHWLPNQVSASNIRMPISLTRPASGSSTLLIVSDHRWDTSWFTEFKQPNGTPLGGWKWMQVTCATAPGSGRQRIWSEPQLIGMGDVDPAIQTTPPVLALVGMREYLGVGPNTTTSSRGCGGISYGEVIGPMQCFKVYADRWTRVWLEYTVTAGSDLVGVSWWMADEVQDPVQILDGSVVQQAFFDPIGEFWFEYNTSYPERLGGVMNAWGRNVNVLLNGPAASTLLEKPVG